MIVIGYSIWQDSDDGNGPSDPGQPAWMVAVTAATILFGLAGCYITHRRT
jgi:hypothetical protein